MSTPSEANPPGSGTTSAASRVAATIRSQIIEGALTPGARLPEERVRAELGVSRSSLREGFQQLIQERLLVHHLSRGFFVRELTRGDISDLYTVRRIVECGALRQVTNISPQHLRELTRAVTDGKAAAGHQNWQKVAATSIGFHKALIALAGSPRLDALMNQVLAEFRLSYAYMSDPLDFHAPFLERHAQIADEVLSGELETAASSLHSYLSDAEKALLTRYGGLGRSDET